VQPDTNKEASTRKRTIIVVSVSNCRPYARREGWLNYSCPVTRAFLGYVVNGALYVLEIERNIDMIVIGNNGCDFKRGSSS